MYYIEEFKDAVFNCVKNKYTAELQVIQYPDIRCYDGIDAATIFSLIGFKFQKSFHEIESVLEILLKEGKIVRTFSPSCFTLAVDGV